MSRRNAAVKRPVLPDPQFNSRLASMMISRLMKHGKKSTAQKILSDAFSLISERTGSNAVELFETAVKNATPLVEVRARSCLLYTSPSPRDLDLSRMPSSA